jgi:Tat protein secretion system quality control protein TatD with DNase activity
MAQKLAEIRDLPVEKIMEITTENAKRLYRI